MVSKKFDRLVGGVYNYLHIRMSNFGDQGMWGGVYVRLIDMKRSEKSFLTGVGITV